MRRSRMGLASACLVLSGFSSLALEVCWIRQGSLVFGSATVATSTLLGVFFGGLAIGSALFARLASRVHFPLKVYGWIEVAVASLALASLALFQLGDALFGHVYASLGDRTALLTLVRACLVALVILPPTVLMGATLPAVCMLFANDRTGGVRAIARLYAANTVGAAGGTLAAGFVLIPAVGLTLTVAIAALANVLAAGLAYSGRIHRPATRQAGQTETGAATPRPEAGPPKQARAARKQRPKDAPLAPRRVSTFIALFAVAGFSGLAYEVLWTRFLALVQRNTVYTYTLSLAVVLIGIVLGSLLAPRFAQRARPAARAFGVLVAFAGLYVLLLMRLPPAFWQRIGADAATCLVIFLPPAVLSGAAFPLGIRAVSDDGESLGGHVGRMAAVHTTGGILGSIAMGFVGLPLFGMQTSVLAVTALSVLVGAGGLLLASGGGWRGFALPAAFALAWLALPWALDARVPERFLATRGTLLAFHEGLTSNVAVLRDAGVTRLEIDRWWQGQDTKTHQIMVAHVPMALAPEAKRILVVGAGTGQTASRFLAHDVEHVAVIDIEPAVFSAIPGYFDDAWMHDPRVALIRDDGRNHIAHASTRYDIISLEVGQVFRPGVASFYTVDFYTRARARLTSGGLITQFVPLPFFSESQLARVIASFTHVFPAAVLWYNTSELLLIGARADSVALDFARLATLVQRPGLAEDLVFSPWGDLTLPLSQPERFAAGFLAGPVGLAALASGAPPYRDDRPILEYEMSRPHTERMADAALAATIARHVDPFETILGVRPADSLRASLVEVRRQNLEAIVSAAHLRRAEELLAAADPSGARAAVALALDRNPRNVPALRVLGNLLVAGRRLEEAQEAYRRALALDARDPVALRGLGAIAIMEGRHDDAIAYLGAALETRPADAETHSNLGALLAQRNDRAAALAHFEEAVRLDPASSDARANLERLERAMRDPGR